MPYVIAVLALVVISVGFTLFQSQGEVTMEMTSLAGLEVAEEAPDSAIVTNTIPNITDTKSPLAQVQEEAAIEPVIANPPSETPKLTPTPSPTPTPVLTTDFKNGGYATQSSYRTPDGTYQINVNLTIENDKITNSSISFDADGARDSYSKRFSNSYQSAIIGQDLGTASLSRVGGASLTTKAFNIALAGIRFQATS